MRFTNGFIARVIWMPAALLLLAGLLSACGGGKPQSTGDRASASQEARSTYPEKNITLAVPGGPGGGFDLYSRAVAKAMERYLPNKVNIVVENMPGAGGRQTYDYVAKSKPDGYTIGSVIFPGALVTQLVQETNYDLNKYTWIGNMATDKYVVVVPSNSKFKTLEDMQKSEKPVRFGSQGFGTTDFVVDVIGSKIFGIPSTMVSGYKGSAEATVGAMRGDIDAMSYPITSMYEHIRSGDLRALVLLDTKRNDLLPDVPTAAELGYPEAAEVAVLYRLLGAPPGLPDEITKVLRDAMGKAMQDKELLDWAQQTTHPLDYVPGEKVAEIVQKATASYSKYKEDLIRYATQGQGK